MIAAKDFVDGLNEQGFTHCSGVPCSILTPLINRIIDDGKIDYTPATSEGEAVGINFGVHLAGGRTVTICQNSGLGNTVNPLTSMNYPFRVPTLLVVTWRGEPGSDDAPQHELMGEITPELLETMRIPRESFPEEQEEIGSILEEADSAMSARSLPYSLLMSRGEVSEYELKTEEEYEKVNTEVDFFSESPAKERITRRRAIKEILGELEGDEARLGTTGKTGRELYDLDDRENNFYIIGGMGTASAIGFGIARTVEDRPVVVLDGDGSALMKMGNLATIGAGGAKNLKHIVLDNECYDSTGGQSSSAGVVRFDRVAANCNYRLVMKAGRSENIRRAVRKLLDQPGPGLLQVKIKKGSPENLPRPHLTPVELKERFMGFLRE